MTLNVYLEQIMVKPPTMIWWNKISLELSNKNKKLMKDAKLDFIIRFCFDSCLLR